MKPTGKIVRIALIASIVLLSLAYVAQAGYKYKKTVTVDHNRVVAGPLTPPDGYSFLKTITIDNTKVSGTADLTDFPVLVRIQNDANLKTTDNGGRVTDPEGDDIVFYASDLATRLDHEVKQYDGATGTLLAWVRLPVLKFDVDTVFYLAYANSSISTSQENIFGAWDSNFKGVCHLKESGDGSYDEFQDSTSNAHHGRGCGGVASQTPRKRLQEK